MRLLNVFYPGEDRFAAMFPPPLLDELRSLVEYRAIPKPPPGKTNDPDYLAELYEAEILLTGWGSPMLPVDLAQRGKLKYICHVTGGVRSVIPRELFEQGVLVTNWGSSISRTIAEASLMMILACLRRVRPIQEELHNRGNYRRGVPWPDSLFERRVGLLGFGAIARDLVSLLKPFNVTIKAFDPYVSEECFTALGVERVEQVRTLFETCDVISLHAGRTEETTGMVNKEMLRLLPDDGVLVNTARGALINEDDLLDELRAGRLWVALDVYEREPLPVDSPFRGIERLLLFPHQAGPTIDRYVDMGRMAVDNIRRYLGNEPVLAQVTVEKYDTMT
ncbi:MAG: hydroxyacid dehydrogenase [Limnochordia bacterium]|jgi:phosphoglycerate dehydrogenase-like enzyme